MKITQLISLAGLLFLLSNDVLSQTDGIIEHVIVTTTLKKSQAQTALPITVVSGDELKGIAATSVGDTLANLPGLSNASFGPAVGQPVIRGQQGPRVTVLQNGIATADASRASADHFVSVEPVLAESVEILRGPATLLYGGGAIGGVVNVIDHRIAEYGHDGISGEVELRHGSVNDERTAVMKLAGGNSSMAFYIDGLTRKTNDIEIPGFADEDALPSETSHGFIANSDTDTSAVTVGGSLIFERGYIGMAINRLDSEYGIPAGSHVHAHDEEEEDDEDAQSIRLDIEQIRYDLKGAFYGEDDSPIERWRWALTRNNYQHDELESDGQVGTHFSNDAWLGRVEALHSVVDGWQGTAGLQFEDSKFAATGEEAFIPETDIFSYGLFLLESFEVEPVLYEFGIRYGKDQVDTRLADKSFDSLSYSASALWEISERWSLGVALSSSERAPVTEELFSNAANLMPDLIVHGATGNIEVGNPNLDVETSNNIDVTVSYSSDQIEGFVTLFHNDFQDYIFLANSGLEQDEVAIFDYRQDSARFTGVEFEVNFALGSVLGSDVGVKVFGDAIHGKLDDAGAVPRMPPLRIGSRMDFTHEAYSGYLSVLRAADQRDTGQFGTSTEGYIRWDTGISYRFPAGSNRDGVVFLTLKNIFNEEIRSSVSFLRNSAPEAGRSLQAGVRFSF